MYPNSAYNVNMERTTSGDINDNTFHPPMSLQSRYISFEWNPDKHNSNVEKNCSFSETAYKPDTTSQRLHPLQSYHRQLDSLEPNNSALDSKPETVQTNYWALNQMDVLYANDILSLDSPHIKQEAFHCSNGELASSALYPIPPPNAPASSPHSQISTRNREPHAFCHYNDIFELNNCPTDDYVVTFLK